MKKVSIIALILLCVLFGSCRLPGVHGDGKGTDGGSSSGKTGPITLTVIDQQTGLPVPNITVIYEVEKARPIFIEVEYITIDIQKLKTDNNGQITIPAKKYNLILSEQLLCRSFYINLDTKDGKMPKEEDMQKFSSFILTNIPALRERNNVVKLGNTAYTATEADFFNVGEVKNSKSIWEGNYLHYSFDAPFSEKEVKETVELARNTGS